jgi:two-component system sensor histidine kinase AlgZ
MPTPATTRPPIDAVIPDFCSIHAVMRILVAVNAFFFTVFVMSERSWKAGISAYINSSTLIYTACLVSLVILCSVRRLVRAMPRWAQRLVCILVPALTTGIMVHWVSPTRQFAASFPHLTTFSAAVTGGLLGGAVQHYFELYLRAFSPALVEARLQALQARIRPHFLFNSLNAVLSLIRTDPRRAETTLEDLAELFRVLMRDARDLTTLEAEIRLCRQYLSIEQVRLGERLQVKWDTVDISEEVMRRAQIPALLLQPLLENAVHYGVEPVREPALIQIEIHRVIDRIEIAIINPYFGGEVKSDGNHMALNNIRQRLRLLYDVEAELTTMAARGFFEVRLRIPYVKVS